MYVLDWTGTLTVHHIFPRHSAPLYTIHSRRMYFDNHQVAYYNDGIGGQPRMLYDFGAIRKDMKILAVILHHSHIVSWYFIVFCSSYDSLLCLDSQLVSLLSPKPDFDATIHVAIHIHKLGGCRKNVNSTKKIISCAS